MNTLKSKFSQANIEFNSYNLYQLALQYKVFKEKHFNFVIEHCNIEMDKFEEFNSLYRINQFSLKHISDFDDYLISCFFPQNTCDEWFDFFYEFDCLIKCVFK